MFCEERHYRRDDAREVVEDVAQRCERGRFIFPILFKTLARATQVPHRKVVDESGHGARGGIELVRFESFRYFANQFVEPQENPAIKDVSALPIAQRAIGVQLIEREYVPETPDVLFHHLVDTLLRKTEVFSRNNGRRE